METINQTKTRSEGGKQEKVGTVVQKITPFLWFDGKAEEAANLYTSLFKNSKVVNTMPGPNGTIMGITLRINEQEFIAFNGGPMFSLSPAISFFMPCETEQEIDRLWEKLSDGGKVYMPLDTYPFSKKYGWIEDKFGVSWQVILATDPGQKITTSLLFVGEQQGKAGEAIKFYTSIFKNSGIDRIERYGAEDYDVEGTIKYGSFSLNGQEFVAMDSSMAHAFNFTPAISLFVKCETQEEIDEFWERLSEGGEKSRCGWLKDKFGVSWQIVPPVLGEMLSDPDPEKSKRVMNAMLQMDKLDIKVLKQAYTNDSPKVESPTSKNVLEISRVFDFPVSIVWKAWTEPESSKKWWGPKDFTCPYSSIDLRVGGKTLSCMRSPQGDEFWSTGVYREIIPLKKLVCTDSFSDEKGNVIPASDLNMPGNWPLELLITVTFEELDGKTRMLLKHEGLPPEMYEDCQMGWQQSFDKLEENFKYKAVI